MKRKLTQKILGVLPRVEVKLTVVVSSVTSVRPSVPARRVAIQSWNQSTRPHMARDKVSTRSRRVTTAHQRVISDTITAAFPRVIPPVAVVKTGGVTLERKVGVMATTKGRK